MNVVGTVLLTSIENPMCPGCDNYPPDVDLLREWARSMCSDTTDMALIVHDELPMEEIRRLAAYTSAHVVQIKVEPTADNLFVQRWMHHRNWLRLAEAVEYVWLTDGTDVVMLNPPWEHMNNYTLYVGSENDKVTNAWILQHHPSLHEFAATHRNNRLLNAGLLGGHRDVVLPFLDALIERGLASPGDTTDMAAFNLELYLGDRYFETGYPIHTPFNARATSDPRAYFAHK